MSGDLSSSVLWKKKIATQQSSVWHIRVLPRWGSWIAKTPNRKGKSSWLLLLSTVSCNRTSTAPKKRQRVDSGLGRDLRLTVAPYRWWQAITTLVGGRIRRRAITSWITFVCRKSNKSNVEKTWNLGVSVILIPTQCSGTSRELVCSYTCRVGHESLGQGPQAMGRFWLSSWACQ